MCNELDTLFICVFLNLTSLLLNMGANFNEGHISHSHFAYVLYKPGLISFKKKDLAAASVVSITTIHHNEAGDST